MIPRGLLAASVALSMAMLSGCNTNANNENTVTIYAAASLAEVFSDIANQYEQANPNITIELSFAGSARLAAQIIAGARADVFASADQANMARVLDAGYTTAPPKTFARNQLALVVPKANPGHINKLADLANNRLVLAACAPEVPCGALAKQVLQDAGVQANPDTYETSVRAVLTKVTLGEADAGLVYATDVVAGGNKVMQIPIDPGDLDNSGPPNKPSQPNTPNNPSQPRFTEYPLATITNKATAADFANYVLSPQAQHTLALYGFKAP